MRVKQLSLTPHTSQNDHIEDIVARQESSNEARAKLKAVTDEWKALPADDKAAGAVKVIKAYQGEVNALTRRARAVESSFSTVFSDFAAAVDPVPALQAGTDAASTAADLQRSLTAARAEVSATDEELQGLANQEVTIRRLTERVEQLSAQLDSRVAEAVSLREAELTAAHQEELRAAHTAEGNALRRAALAQDTADAAVKRAQQAASAQAAAAASGASSSSGAAAQVQLLSDELTMLTQQMHAMQAQNSTLNKRLREFAASPPQGTAGGGSNTPPTASASEAEVQRLTAELEAAKQRASAASTQLLTAKAQAQAAQEAATAEATAVAAQLQALQGELDARPSADAFQELKEELHMLQRVYFSPANGDGSAPDGVEGGGDSPPLTTTASGLSAAVLRRARQLEGTVVALRQDVDTARAKTAAAEREVAQMRSELVAATNATDRLQHELALATGEVPSGNHAKAPGTPPRGEGVSSTPGGFSAEQQLLSVLASPGVQANVQAGTFRGAPVEAGDSPGAGPSTSAASEGASQTTHDASAGTAVGGVDLSAVFQAQRDRFRLAAEDAEAATGEAKAEAEAASAALRQMEADNVKLYEQIRYLEAMVAGPGRGAGMAHGQGASAAFVAGDAGRTATIGSALAGGPMGPAGQRMAALGQRAGSQQGGLWDALSLLLLRIYWSVMDVLGSARGAAHGHMLRVPGALSSSGGILPGQSAAPSGAAAAVLPDNESAFGSAAAVGGGEEGGRYRAKFEESMDPFAAFKERQREAATASLSCFDRSALSLAGSLVSTGGSRTVAIAYLLAVHLFAFLWLWC